MNNRFGFLFIAVLAACLAVIVLVFGMLPGDSGSFVMAIALGILAACYIASIIWAYRDAGLRGKPAWAVALLVALLSWPFGLLAWIIFRPALRTAS